LQYKVARHRPQ